MPHPVLGDTPLCQAHPCFIGIYGAIKEWGLEWSRLDLSQNAAEFVAAISNRLHRPDVVGNGLCQRIDIESEHRALPLRKRLQ
jgi:hypothetical protein